MPNLRINGCCLALFSLLSGASAALGVDLEITVTSQVPTGGAAFSPVWLGVHDGSFDTFDPGSAAGSEVEAIAELADAGPISTTFAGTGPQTTLASPGGPFAPGATNSTTLSVPMPATHRYLSFLAMIVPSNDLFIGNPGPTDIELFDAGGAFVGPITLNIFGSNVWDAGSEVNNASDGAAFIVGSDATLGTPEGGVISLFLPDDANYLDGFLGLTTAAGYTFSEVFDAGNLIATIEITQVPEPSTAVLACAGAAALAAVGLRRRVRRASRT